MLAQIGADSSKSAGSVEATPKLAALLPPEGSTEIVTTVIYTAHCSAVYSHQHVVVMYEWQQTPGSKIN